jgi:hypothetical protein
MCAGSRELEGYRQAMSCITVFFIHACVTIRCIIPDEEGEEGKRSVIGLHIAHSKFALLCPLCIYVLFRACRTSVCLPLRLPPHGPVFPILLVIAPVTFIHPLPANPSSLLSTIKPKFFAAELGTMWFPFSYWIMNQTARLHPRVTPSYVTNRLGHTHSAFRTHPRAFNT